MAQSESEPIIVWQIDGCWDLPSASPFCIKLQAWLRMAGVAHEVRALRGRPRSANGKVPYVQMPDGRMIGDTAMIMDTLSAERGLTLDEGLDERQRATATTITRMLEDHFYWAIVWDRWILSEHWPRTKSAYFGWMPPPVRWLVPVVARRGVRRAFDGQGFGRMSDDQIVARIEQDLDALSSWLRDAEHCLGRPSSLDAIVYAFLTSAMRTPFDGPLRRAVAGRDELVTYCDRFEARWWPCESS